MFFPPPQRQSRLTVLFRPLLAMPHGVVLALILLVGLILVVVGWCAALVLGRLPIWIATYEVRALEYYARYDAYTHFLNGRFPPFRWQPGGYPIAIRVRQSRVRRLSVLFRAIRVIPAEIVAGVAGAGVALVSPLVWLVVLIRGRMPAPIHYSIASVLRYRIRLGAYGSMLTSAYPRELMGDGIVERYPDERDWFLPLTVGSRRLLYAFVVLGVVGLAGYGYLGNRLSEQNTRLAERNSVVSAYNRLMIATIAFRQAARACAGSKDRLRCVQHGEPALADALERFRADLAATGLPESAALDQVAAERAADRMAKLIRAVSTAKSLPAYLGMAGPIPAAARQVDAATQRLIADLT